MAIPLMGRRQAECEQCENCRPVRKFRFLDIRPSSSLRTPLGGYQFLRLLRPAGNPRLNTARHARPDAARRITRAPGGDYFTDVTPFGGRCWAAGTSLLDMAPLIVDYRGRNGGDGDCTSPR